MITREEKKTSRKSIEKGDVHGTRVLRFLLSLRHCHTGQRQLFEQKGKRHSGLEELVFVLFDEALAHREELPVAVVVLLSDEGLLSGVLGLVLVDEMLQEEPGRLFPEDSQVIREVVFLRCVDLETAR